MMQCTAVRCSVLQSVAECCSVLQYDVQHTSHLVSRFGEIRSVHGTIEIRQRYNVMGLDQYRDYRDQIEMWGTGTIT